jgi:hypothetical protein
MRGYALGGIGERRRGNQRVEVASESRRVRGRFGYGPLFPAFSRGKFDDPDRPYRRDLTRPLRLERGRRSCARNTLHSHFDP